MREPIPPCPHCGHRRHQGGVCRESMPNVGVFGARCPCLTAPDGMPDRKALERLAEMTGGRR